MSGSQVFVCLFGVLSVSLSVCAIWRVASASGVKYKPLWIAGCLLGFVGFATNLTTEGDLYLQFGIQIPVVMWMTLGDGTILKALFPFVAAIALVKFPPSQLNETRAG